MKFEIGKALQFEVGAHDTHAWQQGNVKAILYKTNQALLLDMEEGAPAAHNEESWVATIEVLEGVVALEFDGKSEILIAHTEKLLRNKKIRKPRPVFKGCLQRI